MPSGPRRFCAARLVGAWALAAAWTGAADTALAQAPPPAPPPTGARLAVGVEASLIAGRRDDGRDARPGDPPAGFFNYTDYEHNALRTARLRLIGEFRATPGVSVLAELRQEDTNRFDVPAFYVRWRPRLNHALDLHAGRVPPVIGAFGRRAYGRDNPMIGTPLPYQYLTALRPDALPARAEDIARMRARGWRLSYPIGNTEPAPGVPLASVLRWDTGVSARWRRRSLVLAGAVTLGAPAVPVVRETNRGRQWSGRVALDRGPLLIAGLSLARGAWIDDDALGRLPASASRRSAQRLVGADLESGWGRWLLRAEWLRTSFDVPLATSSDSTSLSAWGGFGELRWRISPRWHAAMRVERLRFGRLPASGSVETSWDAGVDRAEAAVGLRITRRIDVRAAWQKNWRDGGRSREQGFPALQLLFSY